MLSLELRGGAGRQWGQSCSPSSLSLLQGRSFLKGFYVCRELGALGNPH